MTEKTRLVASVAVENSVYHFDKAFDYLVPQHLTSCVTTGCRVLVPFSRSNKKKQGFILALQEKTGTDKLKEIFSLLDDTPLLTEEMARLVFFMKEHCYCTLYDAAKAMLPAGIGYKVTPVYSVAVQEKDEMDALGAEEERVLSCIRQNGGSMKKEPLFDAMGYLPDNPLPDKMVRSGLLLKSDDAVRRVGDKSVKMLKLKEPFPEDAGKTTAKQDEVLNLLRAAGAVSVRELCYYTGLTAAVADALVKKGLCEYFSAEVLRAPYRRPETQDKKEIVLTGEQQAAFDGLLREYRADRGQVSLLYGITGSGKTSVFMKLIDHAVQDQKGVIVMVPEIALTPQMISIFASRYGDDVAVFHSGLSMGERLDEWKRVRRGLAKIAVGTRSAVFAPFEKIGLVIMDEEQEYTYKSESAPRYHAREIAKRRCMEHNCMLLLSSATPSVESFYRAKTGTYSLHILKNRYGSAKLPEVLTADMNIEQEQGNTTGFSSVLLEGLEENLAAGRQSILLLNRRGHNTFVSCRRCKEIVSCPNCSISLTYHSANNRLMCHYCGYSQSLTDECPACHSHSLRYSGMGTQRAQQTLCGLFPQARILRLDADATMSKYAHEKLLGEFSNGAYDMMIGTQMVAKGLDFPNVTLVGVLNADQMLYGDDFRSYERAFSLLTQVVGRSGRGGLAGRAVIQTYTPENPVIQLAAMQDYERFFESEIMVRKAMLYPPFAQLCMIGFVGGDDKKTYEAAKAFTAMLCHTAKTQFPGMPLRVLGPTAAMVIKVSNKYRYKLVLKFKNDKTFRSMLSGLLVSFGKNRAYADVTAYADINPDSIL